MHGLHECVAPGCGRPTPDCGASSDPLPGAVSSSPAAAAAPRTVKEAHTGVLFEEMDEGRRLTGLGVRQKVIIPPIAVKVGKRGGGVRGRPAAGVRRYRLSKR